MFLAPSLFGPGRGSGPGPVFTALTLPPRGPIFGTLALALALTLPREAAAGLRDRGATDDEELDDSEELEAGGAAVAGWTGRRCCCGVARSATFTEGDPGTLTFSLSLVDL